ncbi:hypothetical protein A8C56_03245 [Niabella ginsenosidivorans]|uniref:NAD(P)-binding domain-containing protein n=1 Tax=Niabella ginsenosidivorans TaxID=1176587 RepID=A0A1A9I068_9BACT|nr:NAD(P)H-binding protein [Niabella ginsenosidivorans]ANH80130.1 hypothetical protein A8C56_03245 [Niabella ginsenosidivorans]
MNILIFGASGCIGQEITQLALQEGHYVTAFTRSVEKINHLRQNHLSFFQDDIMNADAVLKAIKSKDIVINVIEGSHRLHKVRVQGTRHIINAMTVAGVNRLLCHTSFIPDKEHPFSTVKQLIHKLSGARRKTNKMHHELEHIIGHSSLNWTIVRSPVISRQSATAGKFPAVPPERKTGQMTAARKTARFILFQLQPGTHNSQKIISLQESPAATQETSDGMYAK